MKKLLKTKTIILCNGKLLTYKPKYQTTSECGECGTIHKIDPFEIDIPSRHAGPFEHPKSHTTKCIACGKEELDFSHVMDMVIAKALPSIIKEFERDDAFYKFLNKKNS